MQFHCSNTIDYNWVDAFHEGVGLGVLYYCWFVLNAETLKHCIAFGGELSTIIINDFAMPRISSKPLLIKDQWDIFRFIGVILVYLWPTSRDVNARDALDYTVDTVYILVSPRFKEINTSASQIYLLIAFRCLKHKKQSSFASSEFFFRHQDSELWWLWNWRDKVFYLFLFQTAIEMMRLSLFLFTQSVIASSFRWGVRFCMVGVCRTIWKSCMHLLYWTTISL